MTDTTTTRWDELTEAGRQALAQGNLARADEMHRAALAEAERLWPDSARLANSLASVAQVRYQARDHATAETLFRRALELRERLLGADHPTVAQTLNNLAAVHVARGAHDAAEPLLLRALGITEKHRGASHPDVAVNLNNLAKLYFKRNEHARAEPLLERLLEIKRAAGPANPEVATVLASLATVHLAGGVGERAEAMLREAIAIRQQAGSPEDAALANLYESLADACVARDNLADAIVERARAMAIRERLVGAGHASVVAAREKLEALRAERQRREAERQSTADAPAPAPAPAAPVASARVSGLHLIPDLERARASLEAMADASVAAPEPGVVALPDAGVDPSSPPPRRASGPLPYNPWLAEAEPPSVIAAETGEYPAAQLDAGGAVARPSTGSTGLQPDVPPIMAELATMAAQPPVAPLVAPPLRPPPVAAPAEVFSGVASMPAPGARQAPGGFNDSWGREGAGGAMTLSATAMPDLRPDPVGIGNTASFAAPRAPLAEPRTAERAGDRAPDRPAPARASGALRASDVAAAPGAALAAPAAPAHPAPAPQRAAPRKPRFAPEGTTAGGGGGGLKLAVAAVVLLLAGAGGWLALRPGAEATAPAATTTATVPARARAAAATPAAATPAIATEEHEPVTSSPIATEAPRPRAMPDESAEPRPARLPSAPPPMISMDQITRSIDSTTKKVDVKPIAPAAFQRP